MTYNVSSGTLNHTHSLTRWPIKPEVVNAHAPQFSSSRLAHFMLVSTIALLFLVYFWSNLVRRSTLPEKRTQPQPPRVIYAHARCLTSGFLTNLLKVPLNVGWQAKYSRLIANRGRRIHFRRQICDRQTDGQSNKDNHITS